MAGPPVDATVHRRAAGSIEFSETGTARRNDPILIIDELGHVVAVREPAPQLLAVLIHPRPEVAGDAGVEDSVALVG
jgi:hypothetical protein